MLTRHRSGLSGKSSFFQLVNAGVTVARPLLLNSGQRDNTGVTEVPGEPSDDRMVKLQDAILHYLASHPQASDTARGIARFWIADALPELPSQDAVQRALDCLAAQGRISCTVLVDGTRVYEAVAQRPRR
jgi:hypothetical protein